MFTPEVFNLPPVPMLQYELEAGLEVLQHGGFNYIEAVDPPPKTLVNNQFAEPFGLVIEPEEGSSRSNVYLHTVNLGVLSTDQLVLDGSSLYRLRPDGKDGQLTDNEVYYLYQSFCRHDLLGGFRGGMRGLAADTYYKELETKLLGYSIDRLSNLFYEVTGIIDESRTEEEIAALEKNFVFKRSDTVDWIQFNVMMDDLIRAEHEGETVRQMVGRLLTRVGVTYCGVGKPAAFAVKPDIYRVAWNSEPIEVGGKPVEIHAVPAVAVSLHERVPADRLKAISDINRVIGNSQVIFIKA